MRGTVQLLVGAAYTIDMSTFEKLHPRSSVGTFSSKNGSAPDTDISYEDLTTIHERDSTANLLESYTALDAIGAQDDREWAMLEAAADTITSRHHLEPAIEELMLDDPEFSGTYYDAVVRTLANSALVDLEQALENEDYARILTAHKAIIPILAQDILEQRGSTLPASLANILLTEDLPRVFRVEYAMQTMNTLGYADEFIRDEDPFIRRAAAQSPALSDTARQDMIARLQAVGRGAEAEMIAASNRSYAAAAA